MFPVAVSIPEEGRPVRVGQKMMYPIFHFDLLPAVLTVDLKHWEQRCSKVLRIPFNEDRSPRNYPQKLLNYDSLLEAENSVFHLAEFVQK